MNEDDTQYLLTVALEMRLLARARALDATASLTTARMDEIAERLERIARRIQPAERRRRSGSF